MGLKSCQLYSVSVVRNDWSSKLLHAKLARTSSVRCLFFLPPHSHTHRSFLWLPTKHATLCIETALKPDIPCLVATFLFSRAAQADPGPGTRMDLVTLLEHVPALLAHCVWFDDYAGRRCLRLVSKEASRVAMLGIFDYRIELIGEGGHKRVCVARLLRPTRLRCLSVRLLLSGRDGTGPPAGDWGGLARKSSP